MLECDSVWLTLSDEVRLSVEEQAKCLCSLVAVCNESDPDSSPCRLTPQEFYSRELANECLWIQAKPVDLPNAIRHYLKVKNANPTTTSALIMVPHSKGAKEAWTPALKGMLLVRQYSNQAQIFRNIHTGAACSVGKAVDIWWDPPYFSNSESTCYQKAPSMQ